MRKILLSFILCSIFQVDLYGQETFSNEYDFIRHLESVGDYREGFQYLSGLRTADKSAGDSIYYFMGRFSYLAKNREKSIKYFSQVSSFNIPLFNASRFYLGLQAAYLQQYQASDSAFSAIKPRNTLDKELRNYEQGSLALLNRDFESYQRYFNSFDTIGYQMKDYYQSMDNSYNTILDHKRRSAVTAGILSAIIPGAGKMYLGQYGKGILSLVATSIFGLQAYEGYRKDGPRSVTFIAFSSLFTLFHVSNIYGTVIAVRVAETNFNNNENETILLNMHIPIRLFYN